MPPVHPESQYTISFTKTATKTQQPLSLATFCFLLFLDTLGSQLLWMHVQGKTDGRRVSDSSSFVLPLTRVNTEQWHTDQSTMSDGYGPRMRSMRWCTRPLSSPTTSPTNQFQGALALRHHLPFSVSSSIPCFGVQVGRRAAPPNPCCRYDHRFIVYGNDKMIQAYECAHNGWKFVAVPSSFVVHLDHGRCWGGDAEEGVVVCLCVGVASFGVLRY